MKKIKKYFKYMFIIVMILSINTVYAETTVKDNNTNNKVVGLENVYLNKNNITLETGNMYTLSTSVTPSNVNDVWTVWESSDPSIASVDNGNIIARKPGKVTITVTASLSDNAKISSGSKSKKATCIVTVVKNTKKLKLNGCTEATVGKAKKITSNIIVKKWDYNNKKVKILSNKRKETNFRAKEAGTITITATSLDNKKATCKITIKKAQSQKKANSTGSLTFYESIIYMSDKVKEETKAGKKWKFSNSGTSSSFDEAIKKDKRKTNSAKYVSWALVKADILKDGEWFYKKKKNKIRYKDKSTKENMKANLKYINANNKKAKDLIKNGTLKVGDIVLWSKYQHVTVYGGNNKWYDAGRIKTINGCSSKKKHCTFNSFGPNQYDKFYNHKIWKILRVKENLVKPDQTASNNDKTKKNDNTKKVTTTNTKYGVFLDLDKKNVSKLNNYNLVVIEPEDFSSKEVNELKTAGKKVWGYLNVGSIEKNRSYYKKFKKYTLGKYDDWPSERWMDISKKKWQDYVVEKLAKKYVGMGFQGFYVDNLDVYSEKGKKSKLYKGGSAILKRLKALNVTVMVNGADEFVSKSISDGTADSLMDAINQEEVFTVVDCGNKEGNNCKYKSQKSSETKYYKNYLQKVKQKTNLHVFLLEYGTDKGRLEKIKKYCAENGFDYYYANNVDLN